MQGVISRLVIVWWLVMATAHHFRMSIYEFTTATSWPNSNCGLSPDQTIAWIAIIQSNVAFLWLETPRPPTSPDSQYLTCIWAFIECLYMNTYKKNISKELQTVTKTCFYAPVSHISHSELDSSSVLANETLSLAKSIHYFRHNNNFRMKASSAVVDRVL